MPKTPAELAQELAPAAQPGEVVQSMAATGAEADGIATVKTVADDDLDGFDAGSFVDEPEETSITQEAVETAPTRELPKTQPTEEPPAPAQAEAPPAPSEPKPQEVPAPTQAQPQAPAPAEPPVSSEPILTPEQQQEQYQNWFNSSVEALAGQVYQLTPEMAEELDQQPSKVLPKLAAQLHMQVLVGATTQAANLLMTMLPEYQKRQQVQDASVKEFYEEYPTLRGHEKEVDDLADTYAARNPKVDRETFKRTVAAMAHVQLRIPLPANMQPPALTPPPVAVTPTGAGAAPAAIHAPSQGKTVWEEIIEED